MAKGETLREWRKANLYRLSVDFYRNNENDKPLIQKLEEQTNKAAYVKGLIKEDIQREGNAQESEKE